MGVILLDNKLLNRLSKRILSIDFGSYSTRFVVGKSFGSEVSVERMVTAQTPQDLYQDGQILNLNNMNDFIQRVTRDEKLKCKLVSFTFESSALIMKEISVPLVKSQDLKKMVEYEIEQYLPIDMSQYNIQYKNIGVITEDGVKKSNFLVVALPKTISDNYIQLANLLDLKPYALDIHSNCINKLFKYKSKINENFDLINDTIAVLDLGHLSTSIVIIEKGVFKFSRLVNMGGKDIDIHIANGFNLSLAEASNKKKEIKDLNNDFNTSPTEAMVKETIISAIESWMQEIERVFKFYTTRATGNTIDRIYIHGGTINLKGIKENIEGYFNIPTFRINNLSTISVDDKDKREPQGISKEIDINPYLNAIGAIIRR